MAFYDVLADCGGEYLKYYHYTRNNTHIYMFVNEDIHNTVNAKVSLSAFNGGEYIEYDGFENKAVLKNSGKPEIEISVDPYHSLMIVFGDVCKDGIKRYEEKIYSQGVEIKPEFKISLMGKKETEFKTYKTTNELFDITGRDGIPRFSGQMKYEAEIEMDKADCILDLGYVGEAVEVYLNDKFVGAKQIPPYRFEISKGDIREKNNLTVIVSNHSGYEMKDPFSKYLLFEPSGLLGKIKLEKCVNGD